MDLITQVQDTLPTWLGGLGGILSALIAGYALYRAVRAESRHVEWQVTNERKEGRRSDSWRLVNSTSGVTAHVDKFENISDGVRDAIRSTLPLPTKIASGVGMPFSHARSLVSPFPTVVRVTWRESKPNGKPRRRQYSSTLYLD